MGQSLFQLQNGMVLVVSNNKAYQDVVDNFKKDYADSNFTGKAKEIIYNQTLKIHMVDGNLMTPTSDDGLDVVIDRLDDLIAKQAARNPQPAAPEATFAELQQAKFNEIDTLTKRHITGGFTSAAKGTANTYDSADADQLTFAAMYAASRSVDFATTEPYMGEIPIRAIPAGKADKIIIGHKAGELQKLMDDLALHIGICKQTGWTLQTQVMAAKNKAALDKIIWPG